MLSAKLCKQVNDLVEEVVPTCALKSKFDGQLIKKENYFSS